MTENTKLKTLNDTKEEEIKQLKLKTNDLENQLVHSFRNQMTEYIYIKY
jgi:hypothetical protein